jgi:hypothetical protein
MKVILGLLSTPWYSVISMKNRYKIFQERVRAARVHTGGSAVPEYHHKIF